MTRFSSHETTRRMTQLGLLAALIVVLQMISALLAKFVLLPVSITLTLVPLIIGAFLWGPRGGAELGAVFGIIVLINCITGLDAGGNMMWNANPWLTAIVCLVKGILAGLVAGIVTNACRKRMTLGAFLAGALAPIVNTGTFLFFLVFFFRDILIVWADGSPLGYYVLTGLVGVNFIIEFSVNLVLAPTAAHIIRSIRKQHTQDN